MTIPSARRDVAAGLLFGLGMAGLLALAAAGGRSRDPDEVLKAVAARGVPSDPRLERLPARVRRGVLCTALNVLMESRGEPDAGQVAVAWVTRRRSHERSLPLCDVAFEYLGAPQFSWSAYPVRQIAATVDRSPADWLKAQDVAYRVLIEDAPDPTQGANHFWGHRVIRPPSWARLAEPKSRKVIGGHTFIRIPPRRGTPGVVALEAVP